MSKKFTVKDVAGFCEMSKELIGLSVDPKDDYTKGYLEGCKCTFDSVIHFCKGNGGDDDE